MNIKAPFLCGDANPGGNISFYFKGGCKKAIPLKDAFRCTGCGGWFHHQCIFEHFESEEGHSRAHFALRQIKDFLKQNKNIKISLRDVSTLFNLIEEGLDRSPPSRSLLP